MSGKSTSFGSVAAVTDNRSYDPLNRVFTVLDFWLSAFFMGKVIFLQRKKDFKSNKVDFLFYFLSHANKALHTKNRIFLFVVRKFILFLISCRCCSNRTKFFFNAYLLADEKLDLARIAAIVPRDIFAPYQILLAC